MTAIFSDLCPLSLQTCPVPPASAGLVIVDMVNGFASPGAGALAPPSADLVMDRVIAAVDVLARQTLQRGRPVLAFLDTHHPDKPEPPYPAHCVAGSGEEMLVPALRWLEQEEQVTLLQKDCINGFVGGIDPLTGRNAVTGWLCQQKVTTLIVVGVCTDICVMDFVLTMLSARNHGLAGDLRDIIVYEPGCTTYHLPADVVAAQGLPEIAVHPRSEHHHMGLYMMASRGACLASALDWNA